MSGPPAGRASVPVPLTALRALTRATLGLSLGGVVLGLFAVGALLSAGGALGAASLPPVLLLALGQVGALLAAGRCAALVGPMRAGRAEPRAAAAAAARTLDLVLPGVGLPAGVVAAAMPVLLDPAATAAFASLVSLALLAQLLALVAVLRAPLRRAARSLPPGPSPRSRPDG